MQLLVYNGYILEDAPRGYISKIGDDIIRFDSVGQWKEFIDIKDGKDTKKGCRNKPSNRREKGMAK